MRVKQYAKRYERVVRVAVAMGLASAAMMAASVELKRGEDQIEVTIGGKPFTTYYFHKDVAKAYLMPLRTPSGVIVSRPFPVFNDVSMADRKLPGFEPHQRPLYFDHGDIDGVDFWSEAVFSRAYGRLRWRGQRQAARQRANRIRPGFAHFGTEFGDGPTGHWARYMD